LLVKSSVRRASRERHVSNRSAVASGANQILPDCQVRLLESHAVRSSSLIAAGRTPRDKRSSVRQHPRVATTAVQASHSESRVRSADHVTFIKYDETNVVDQAWITTQGEIEFLPVFGSHLPRTEGVFVAYRKSACAIERRHTESERAKVLRKDRSVCADRARNGSQSKHGALNNVISAAISQRRLARTGR